MNFERIKEMYDFTGKSVVITGGAGVLGSEITLALLGCAANVSILDINPDQAEHLISSSKNSKGKAVYINTNVLKRESLENAANKVLDTFGKVDCLINGAGGNNLKATTSSDQSFFDLPCDAMRFVMDLNLLGTILTSQIFGKKMADQGEGIILNISSMNAFRPLTKVPAYSAAKAAVSNFTQWLAVHMAQEYSPKIRVNAIAPGFFLTQQNRYLLLDESTGEMTPRGKKIIEHTPMGRYGDPKDLIGAILWLLSSASSFVTGIVVPIDGGFSAYSGV
ncbi:MAG: SDR family oxidoreductase [Candidatus Marinimicrobia bacterium]|nr:SDR family oxidoreductase [Candidatus Neomarinimicrobiota bacterium]